MRHLTTIATLLLISLSVNSQTLTERRISSADIGTLVFLAPENWTGLESYDELEAASVYELSSRKEKFNLRLSARYFGSETSDAEIISRLDGYLKYAIAEYIDNPDRYEIRAARFGPGNHGIYARIYDRNAVKASFPFYTHGARVIGEKFVVFTLKSNDADLSVLRSSLDVVTSIDEKNEWANAPDSYLCSVDQLIGFGLVEEEWDSFSSKKVKHIFTVRRSQSGDKFADSSEWVFVGPENEVAETACDNEFIAHGEFVCNGLQFEEFRMDVKTLRFVYVYLGGFHDVPQDVIPDEESPKPQLGIGTCTAQ